MAATLLGHLIASRHWTYEDFCVQYRQASVEVFGKARDVSLRQAERWIHGEVTRRPQARSCRILEHMFRESVDQLLAEHRQPAELPLASGRDTAPASTPNHQEYPVADLGRLILMAAHESIDHATQAASGNVPGEAIDHLQDEVRRLASTYMVRPPTQTHTDLTRARNLTYRLLDSTHRPAQQSDLYAVAGALSAILTCAAFDLGNKAAAWDYSRAAWAYAEIIDQPDLRAWVRGMQASMAYWARRPKQALELAESALDYSSGTATARLLSMQARAHALLGDGSTVRETLAAATDARTHSGQGEVHDLVGGALGFEEAKQAAYGCAAYRYVGNADAAIVEGQRAIHLYTEAPHDFQWLRVEAVARIDLAGAVASKGDLEGAREALAPVFDLDPQQRVEPITKKLTELTGELGSNQAAQRLGEQIEAYALEAAP